jgi:hypothetical protein
MSTTAQRITQQAMDDFLSNNRDLMACMKDSKDVIFERTSAAASLDKSVRDDLTFFSADLDQESKYASKIAQEDFHKIIYAAIAKAFCNLLANGSLRLAMKLTDEADQQQLELRYVSGIEQRPAPKPVVPVLSYDQQLLWDWNNLPVDKINQKRRESAQYRKRLAEILDGNTVGSGITAMHDGSKL